MEYLFSGIVLLMALGLLALYAIGLGQKPKRKKRMDANGTGVRRRMRTRQPVQKVEDPHQYKVESLRDIHHRKQREQQQNSPAQTAGSKEWAVRQRQEDISPSRSGYRAS